MKTLTLFDSVKKQKLPFIPIQENKVKLYVCGPTVYDDSHLGHARSAIAFDLLHRTLLALGYEVEYARNFTDIDDKIIKKTHQTHQSLEEITSYYISSYLQDMKALNILPPTLEPKATQNLEAMVEMIETLLQKNIAYKNNAGDVYLDSSQDKQYGSLSHRGEELEAQSRLENNGEKKNPRDFALWKAYKGEEDIGYETSLGKGRPGWHIECSAMIEKHLAYKNEQYAIDIHGGGADLLFPHHENEASQTRCATSRELAKYWIHNGFVTVNGEKMSKSLGNSFFLKDVLAHYHGEIIRNYLLGTHYRANFDFGETDLLTSKKRLDKLYRLKKRLKATSDTSNSPLRDLLLEALSEDLNISLALSHLENFFKESNEALDKSPKDKSLHHTIASSLLAISEILGLGELEASEYFQLGVSSEEKQEIEAMIAQRNEAKSNKDYAMADHLRNILQERGIVLLDTPQGTFWEKN